MRSIVGFNLNDGIKNDLLFATLYYQTATEFKLVNNRVWFNFLENIVTGSINFGSKNI
jgi:hypothetical protein